MDPIGTITQYFPFLDNETRNVLEETMLESSDYYDFTERLTRRVLDENNPDMVVFLTLHHTALTRDFKAIEKIREKYRDREILGPFFHFASWYQGTYDDITKVHELADKILASNPDDLITLEMCCIKFEADMVNYPQTMYDEENLNIIREFIQKDARFEFYETTLNDYLEVKAQTDGDSEERLRCIERGISIAQKFNDQKRLAYFLYKKARIIEENDRIEARELLKQAYEISEKLGLVADYAYIIQELSKLHAIRGEYSHSIKLLHQVITIGERADLDNSNASLLLSTLYNVIGDYESGLEWGRMAEEQFESRPNLKPRAYFNQAWSLIHLGKFTEARIIIDSDQEKVVKSGDESHLAWLYFVSGLLEMSEGNYLAALSSIQEALKIYENQVGTLFTQLIFLYHLAKIEILSSDEKMQIPPTLAILEEKATSEELPGILGLVLLLKAELSIRQNDDASLRKIIQELHPLAENEKMSFLKPYLDDLLLRV